MRFGTAQKQEAAPVRRVQSPTLRQQAAANALVPDLRPGESRTVVPEYFCPRCQTARGGTTCGMCGTVTEANPQALQTMVRGRPAAAPANVATAEPAQSAQVPAQAPEPEDSPTAEPPIEVNADGMVEVLLDDDVDAHADEPAADSQEDQGTKDAVLLTELAAQDAATLQAAQEQPQEPTQGAAESGAEAMDRMLVIKSPEPLRVPVEPAAPPVEPEDSGVRPKPRQGMRLAFSGGQTPTTGRTETMQTRASQQQNAQRDANGNPVYVMGTGAVQKSTQTPSQVLEDLWADDRVERPVWTQMQASALAALITAMPENATTNDLVDEASATADLMYYAYWKRSNGFHEAA